MTVSADFTSRIEAKVAEQLASQRVGYLLGAGSSYLNGAGYPLSSELWDLIKGRITEVSAIDGIQAKLDAGAGGLEQALDELDDGGAVDTPYRHIVTEAIAELFIGLHPELDDHVEFVRRLARRANPAAVVFSLNYDPLIERAADQARVRLVDGFVGIEQAFFDAAVFEEQTGRIRGSHKGRVFDATVQPVHLLKLHGSLGWYEYANIGVRRRSYASLLPHGAKRLMIPPQRRKAADTMLPPYSALWSAFRGSLGQDARPLNRLACIGYGFADEHVNDIIEPALSRTDFTLLILTKALSDGAWSRWSDKTNVLVVTEAKSSLYGEPGPGHPDLWHFGRLCKEI